MREGKGVLLLIFVAAFTAMAGAPTSARADLGILVPSYFVSGPNSGGPGGSGDGWAAMTAAASQVPITATLNINSGILSPGGSADPAYVNAMTHLENAGGHVIAYVYTSYGTDMSTFSLSNVEGYIQEYINRYGLLINGFFLDGMSTDPAEITPYYSPLYQFIKGLNSSYQVIGNAGTATSEAYFTTPTADTIVTYENDQAYYAGATPPSWVYNYSPSRFANIIYDQPTVAGMQADISLAAQRHVGSVYVTDQMLNGQPNGTYLYDRLPSYWNQEVASIHAFNTVPEPRSSTIVAVCALLAAARFAPWRRAWGRMQGPR
jgi:hypothetical protein